MKHISRRQFLRFIPGAVGVAAAAVVVGPSLIEKAVGALKASWHMKGGYKFKGVAPVARKAAVTKFVTIPEGVKRLYAQEFYNKWMARRVDDMIFYGVEHWDPDA